MGSLAEAPEVAAQPVNEVGIISSNENSDWQQGAELEAKVFTESDYVDTEEQLAQEYQSYLPKTEFVIVKRDNEVVGSTRLIYYDPTVGFKTLNDIKAGRLTTDEEGIRALNNIDLNRTFEVGTLAVTPDMRSRPDNEGRVAVALYSAIYSESQHHDCPNVLASFDEEYFNRFKGIFGASVQQLGPANEYMGSPTVAVLMNMEALLEHLRVTFPDMHKTVLETAASVTHA